MPNLPYIPVPAAGIPVLRPRKRRRKWPWITGLAILVLALCLLTVVLGRHLSFSLSGPGYLPASPGEDWWAQQEEYSTDPPNIRQAPTGTGVTLPLQAAAGPALTYTQIYEKNAPSIVSIESQSQSEYGTGTGTCEKKKLAYDIQKMSEGFYNFIKFEAEATCPAERGCRKI